MAEWHTCCTDFSPSREMECSRYELYICIGFLFTESSRPLNRLFGEPVRRCAAVKTGCEEKVLTVRHFINLLLWLQFECVCVCLCLPVRVSFMFFQAGDWYVWLFASLDGCHVLLIAVLGDLYPFIFFFHPVVFACWFLLCRALGVNQGARAGHQWSLWVKIFFFSLGLTILRPISGPFQEKSFVLFKLQ